MTIETEKPAAPQRNAEVPTQAEAAERRIARSLEETTKPVVRKGNDLGASLRPPVSLAGTKIGVAAVVRHFQTSLYLAADVGALTRAQALLREQQELADAHSPTTADAKTRELSGIYASNPTPANAAALLASRSLTPGDHALTQELARQRIGQILEEISPECRKVCCTAAKLLQKRADGLWLHDSALAGGWDVVPTESSLLREIRGWQRDLENQSKCTAAFGALPEVVVELLRTVNDAN